MLYLKAIYFALIFRVYELRVRIEWYWLKFTYWAEEQIAFHDGGYEAVKELFKSRLGEQDGNQLSELRDGTGESQAAGEQHEAA